METNRCHHPETRGFHIPLGICPKCNRDLDIWYQVQRISEDYYKLWVKTLGLAQNTVSKCCKAPLELGEQEKQYRCSNCGRLL